MIIQLRHSKTVISCFALDLDQNTASCHVLLLYNNKKQKQPEVTSQLRMGSSVADLEFSPVCD